MDDLNGNAQAAANNQEAPQTNSVPGEIALPSSREPGDTGATNQEAANEQPELSKNQRKKLKRRQEWEDGRESRKAQRKEKRVKTRERRREKIESGEISAGSLKKPKIISEQVPITVIIDCDFEAQMTKEELISMGSQLTRSYADHRKARYKTHLAVSSFKGELKDRFETLLSNQHKAWDVRFRGSDFVDVAEEAKQWMSPLEKVEDDSAPGPPGGDQTEQVEPDMTSGEKQDSVAMGGEVIYLTSDSPDTLETLEPHSTYIIGGIVDKNRHKGICYKRACDRKVRTAKLPIGDYIQMSSRRVLTTNHVHEIMLKWLEFRDWGQAFMAVIPQRKGGILKTDSSSKVKIEVESEPDEDEDGGVSLADVETSNNAGPVSEPRQE